MARKKTKQSPASPESFPGDRLIAAVARALDKQKIDYVVIGGQAVIQHGHNRFTGDVDFTVHLPPWEVAKILQLVKDVALTTEIPDPVRWVEEMHVLPCFYPPMKLGVDFSFVASDYIGHAVKRGDEFQIAGYGVRFLALEDLLLQKVIANRPQDRIDVVELLARHATVDFDYIRHWLGQFEQIVEEPLIERFDQLLYDSTQ